MSHNLPLIPLPLKAGAALAKAGLMLPGAGLLGLAAVPMEPRKVASTPPPPEATAKDDDETDRMSCCSDDSELSVGQEVPDDLRAGPQSVGQLQGAPDELSNDSSRYSKDTPSELEFAAGRMQPAMMRPSPTRLHEEFLRNSQLYAEELMRQQMQIVAAARGLSMSPAKGGLVGGHQSERSPTPGEPRVGFRPAGGGGRGPDFFRQDASSPGEGAAGGGGGGLGTSFRGIHSHLSAISQITQNLNSDLSKLTSPTAFRSSRESSQSPPSVGTSAHLHSLHQLHQQQQQQQQQQHHHHQLALAALNNNIAVALNDQSLKFSIDNILKADFGRRITDPLLSKRVPKGGHPPHQHHLPQGGPGSTSNSSRKTPSKSPSAIDLSGVSEQSSSSATLAPLLAGAVSVPGSIANALSSVKQFCAAVSSTTNSSSRASSGSVSSVGSVGSEDISPISPLSSTGSLKGADATGGGAGGGGGSSAQGNGASGASGAGSSSGSGSSSSGGPMVWPAWVYCTRYSDRPSSG
uniref:Uncharacterized protein n=1 Tax=Anopheles farauti TaxID=69004 RepID=A0A182QU30_9DIPT